MATRHVFDAASTSGLEGERLDRALLSIIEHLRGVRPSRNHVKRVLERGDIRVNGEVQTFASHRLPEDAEISLPVALIDELTLTEEDDADPVTRQQGTSVEQTPTVDRHDLISSAILYEDAWIIAVNKPAGLPAQATRDERRDHVKWALARHLADRDGERPYLAVHQRLDVGTSGVMVLARRRDANSGLSEIFQDRLATKFYLAIVTLTEDAALPEEITNHLGVTQTEEGLDKMVAVESGGDWAKTGIEVHERGHEAALIRAQLHTGRRHQIRAHLASVAAPIIGDRLYGGPTHFGQDLITRPMLHAHTIDFTHPITGEAVSIEAPMPEEMRRWCVRLFDQ